MQRLPSKLLKYSSEERKVNKKYINRSHVYLAEDLRARFEPANEMTTEDSCLQKERKNIWIGKVITIYSRLYSRKCVL